MALESARGRGCTAGDELKVNTGGGAAERMAAVAPVEGRERERDERELKVTTHVCLESGTQLFRSASGSSADGRERNDGGAKV